MFTKRGEYNMSQRLPKRFSVRRPSSDGGSSWRWAGLRAERRSTLDHTSKFVSVCSNPVRNHIVLTLMIAMQFPTHTTEVYREDFVRISPLSCWPAAHFDTCQGLFVSAISTSALARVVVVLLTGFLWCFSTSQILISPLLQWTTTSLRFLCQLPPSAPYAWPDRTVKNDIIEEWLEITHKQDDRPFWAHPVIVPFHVPLFLTLTTSE